MKSFLAIILTTFLISNDVIAEQVSHEDIRDAILSLVDIFRDNTGKLERHEGRERQLGEQVKKALQGLDKRYKNQDQNIEKIAALMSSLDSRMKNFETIMRQKDERDHDQLQKSQASIEEIRETLSKMMKEFGGSPNGGTSYTIQGSEREYIENMKKTITSEIARFTKAIDEIQSNPHKCQRNGGGGRSDEEVKILIRDTERILRKIEEQNKDSKLSKTLETQQKLLTELKQLTETNAIGISHLPNRMEMHEINNATHETLQEIKEELMSLSDQSVNKLTAKMDESISGVNNGQEELMKTITEVQSMNENLYADVSKSYEQLLKEIRGLSKVEQVMIQTADNVLDTKRRIEYGVHQILLEVGDLVKVQGKNLNGTVNQRFDDIESTILDNQTGALTNLSSKIETEISQVWRQIGIMYQQLTASAVALDRLQQQTDAYVNGSVQTMDSMEGKVSMITSRMSEVDDNLNYLLGRLSLVTSEFNQIKAGLASALDNIRSSFLEVQNEIKDVGPGPKKIHEKDEENQVSPLVPGN